MSLKSASETAGLNDHVAVDVRRTYTVSAAGWVDGKRRAKGDTVLMHPRDAQYEPLLREDPKGTE